jgi:predicted phage baseplate assembly protein
MGGDYPSFGWFFATYFFLDGIYRDARRGERCLITLHGETRWFSIEARDEWALVVDEPPDTPRVEIDVPSSTDPVVVPAMSVPPVRALFTVIAGSDLLDAPSRKASPTSENWYTVGGSDLAGFSIGLALVSAGTVLGPALAAVTPSDPLRVPTARAPVGSTAATSRLVLKDREARALAVDGSVDFSARALSLVAGTTWSPGLASPLHAFGNVVTAVRGELVTGEVLGSGDASATMHSWKLAKAPLTYHAVAGDPGYVSSLTVWVDGLTWTEVPSFYGAGPEAQVYIVRQDDRGDSWVTFGDGVRGARLPTGGGNVVASYRFGAGAASPPAGSVTQLARPVPGLSAVGAALAAGGGADAEPAESLRELAPRSALLLGRAISIDDMEVAARQTSGVVTARADWAWDGTRQRPVVKVWILGGTGVRASVEERLHALSDPDTPIAVADATPVTATLEIDLELDGRYVPTTVLATVTAALFGDAGWLTPAVLGIDRPLLRSVLLADLLTIPGVTGVRALTWNGSALLDYGVAPGPGAYFDLAATAAITGS